MAFIRKPIVADKPEAVDSFNRAKAHAEETIKGDPDKLLELLSGYQSGTDEDTLKALIPVLQDEIPDSPDFSKDRYQKAVDFHVKTGLITSPPEFDQFI